jgi:hypothetical protein
LNFTTSKKSTCYCRHPQPSFSWCSWRTGESHESKRFERSARWANLGGTSGYRTGPMYAVPVEHYKRWLGRKQECRKWSEAIFWCARHIEPSKWNYPKGRKNSYPSIAPWHHKETIALCTFGIW